MVNPQKIITMTKLALYDKHEGAADRAANDYFRHDYIYRKNLSTRLAVGFGGLIIVVINVLRELFIENVSIFDLDIRYHATNSILIIIAIIAVYSLIGTIQGTREYYLVQKRLTRYMGMLHYLENADERARRPTEEEARQDVESEPRPRPRQRVLDVMPRSSKLPQKENPRGEPETDPLANVAARALSGSRPKPATPLTSRPPRPATRELPQIKFSLDDTDLPLIKKPKPPAQPPLQEDI